MVIQDIVTTAPRPPAAPAIAWLVRAACRGEDPELFFPISAKGPGHAQHERAKSICRRCPVRTPCLDYAMRRREEHGIWGGTDPEERRTTAFHPVRQLRAGGDRR
jgi:WhiB family redox-sensing transcriptional regulator